MRRLLLAGSAAILVLAACGEREEAQYAAMDVVPTAGVIDQVGRGATNTFYGDGELKAGEQFDAPAPPAPPPPPEQAGRQPAEPGQGVDERAQAGALLAYSYGASLEAPARNVRALMTRHEEICRAAGPSLCQILSANVNESGPDYVYANLSLRAEPEWLEAFRDGLESDAESVDGRLTGTTVYAEDLTRQIVDTEARLRAQRILRERLEGLLATQTDDVGDLLAVERELARVQGDIDAQASLLEVMRRRVDMSTLDLSYSSAPAPLSRNAFEPLGRAVNEFFEVFAGAAGLIVRLVAFLIPWLIVGAPAIWGLRRWLRDRKARRTAAVAAKT
jgi:hypothetical protein